MKTAHIAFLVLSLLCASACNHVYYAPNAHNVPLFQEQHEARLMLSQSEGDIVTGGEFQAAYAPFKHVGIIANGYVSGLYVMGHGDYFEGGAGTFYTFANHIVFECYAGYGKGKAINEFDKGDFIKHHFYKYYLQPSIGFTSNYFDIAASTRIAKLDLYGLSHFNGSSPTNQELDDDYKQLLNNQSNFLLEPGITLRAGWKYIKLQAQFSSSVFMGNSNFKIDNTNFNVGLYLSLSKKDKPAFKKFSDYD